MASRLSYSIIAASAGVLLAVSIVSGNQDAGASYLAYGGNPVLAPSQAWERNAIFEPSVVVDDQLLRMWYSGGWDRCAIGYADSADGLHWDKRALPVIGQGASGWEGNACRGFVMQHNEGYRLYFSDDTVNAALWAADSADGLTWDVYSVPVLQGGDWDTRMANMVVWQTDDSWQMIYEAWTPQGVWAMGTAESSDGLAWLKGGRLTDLSIGGAAGGPALLGPDYLVFHAASHGNLPTNLYEATRRGEDWQINPSPLLDYQDWWNDDQVADPFVVGWRGRTWLFYAGHHNGASWQDSYGYIGVAWQK